MNELMHLLLLAVIKIIDNIVITSKTLFIQKNNALFASMAVVVSQLLFYFVINQVIEDNSVLTIVVVSLASGLGSYFAFTINKRISRDRLWVHIVTSNNRADMKVLGDYMRNNQISIITFDSYSDDLERTLTALIFANTRQQSSEVDHFIEKSGKTYNRRIVN